MKVVLVLICAISIFVPAGTNGRVSPAPEMKEYLDRDYGYSFQYPSSWKIETMPEGQANRDIRVVVKAPNAGSFAVVVERGNKNVSKAVFEADPQRAKRVEKLMQETTSHLYQSVSKNLKADDMKVGEQRDLSNKAGIKFYLSTLHTRKTGDPVIVAGIHSYPFSQPYSINFIMTAFWEGQAAEQNETLTRVFNSFHLTGEE